MDLITKALERYKKGEFKQVCITEEQLSMDIFFNVLGQYITDNELWALAESIVHGLTSKGGWNAAKLGGLIANMIAVTTIITTAAMLSDGFDENSLRDSTKIYVNSVLAVIKFLYDDKDFLDAVMNAAKQLVEQSKAGGNHSYM